jgi:hypothetical protein
VNVSSRSQSSCASCPSLQADKQIWRKFVNLKKTQKAVRSGTYCTELSHFLCLRCWWTAPLSTGSSGRCWNVGTVPAIFLAQFNYDTLENVELIDPERRLTEVGNDRCEICGISEVSIQVAMSRDLVGRLTFEQLTRANIPHPRVALWSVSPLQVCQ